MKNRKNYTIHILLSALLLPVLFVGCAKSGSVPESSTAPDGTQAQEQVYYSVRETVIPDPDLELSDRLEKEDQRIVQKNILIKEGVIYRLASRTSFTTFATYEYYLQILEPPYTQWKSVPLPSSFFGETQVEGAQEEDIQEEETQQYYHLVGVEDEQAILEVSGRFYKGNWQKGEEGQLLGELDQSLLSWSDLLYTADHMIYGYRKWENTYFKTGLDQEAEVKKTNGQIYGFFQDPEDGRVYWYGISQGKFGVWDVDSGETKAIGKKKEQTIYYADKQSVYVGTDTAGGICVATRYGFIQLDDQENAVMLFDFKERGYDLDDVLDFERLGESGFRVLTVFENRPYLLELERSERPENLQELVLATTSFPRSGLSMLISQFNRQNDGRYHVTVQTAGEDESYDDFKRKIQLELSAGRGPDLFYGMFDPEDLARSGYLQSLEGILEDGGDYWQQALDTGKIDGVRYGIPCECTLLLAAYNGNLTGDRQSWTLSEMMEAVQNSDAKMLNAGFGGCEIVIYYGLSDNDNKAFIDWETGESHLEGKPFLELMEFAKKYADTGQYPYTEFGKMYLDGQIASNGGEVVLEMEDMTRLDAFFDGNGSFIGFPRSIGNGIYVRGRCIYLSANSDKREAAEAFFRFLLSEESQNNYAEYLTSNIQQYRLGDESGAASPMFPVRLGAVERMIRTKQAEKAGRMAHLTIGIEYQQEGLSEESAEKFRFLVEHARAYDWKVDAIRDIVYEELEPYFNGQRSAEESARILDNRVQLYLDEHR